MNSSHKSNADNLNFCTVLVTWQLQRNRINTERNKEMGRRPKTFSWVREQWRNTAFGGVSEWERKMNWDR